MTITYNITDLSLIAQLCDMAQIRPVSVAFGDTNVSIEFTDRECCLRDKEYLGDDEGVIPDYE